MSNNSSSKNYSTTAVKAVSAVIFCVFTFVYLYCYQADILYVGQHVLSEGATTYNPLVGAILITLALQLLQMLILGLMRVSRSAVALTWFPSFLILTVITDVGNDIDTHFSFGGWLWAVPLLLVIWFFLTWGITKAENFDTRASVHPLLSRQMWINSLAMFLMMLFTCTFSNGNDVFHYRMQVERCIREGNYEAALSCGKNSAATDSSLTMLRAYALSLDGRLADSLFVYPVCGGSRMFLPDGTTTKSITIPPQEIRKHYRQRKNAVDYLLMSLLLDKKIDEFSRTVQRYYRLDIHLPRYYREALVLYAHIRSNPVVVYHETVMDADYKDMTDLAHSTSSPRERESLIRDSYGNTYWCYYFYGKK